MSKDDFLKKFFKNSRLKILFSGVSFFILLSAICGVASATTIGNIAANVNQSFSDIGTLFMAIAYIAGVTCMITSLFKFKQHKDNPTQIPISSPLAMLGMGLFLIFLPFLVQEAGITVTGHSSLGQDAGSFNWRKGPPGYEN